MGIFDKAKDLIRGHEQQVDQVIDKAGDMVDARTGGQHAEQVDKAQEMIKQQLHEQPADPAAGEPASEGELADEPVADSEAPVTDAPVAEAAPAEQPAADPAEQLAPVDPEAPMEPGQA